MQNNKNQVLVGIINPLPYESEYLHKIMNDPKIKVISGVTYYIGNINNCSVVLVNTGLGKVNAAAITSRLIKDFNPTLILVSGSSGSINSTLQKGDVVIGKSIFDADLGKLSDTGNQFEYEQYLHHPQTNTHCPLQFELNKINYDFLVLVCKKINSLKILFGTIATSDFLPNPEYQIDLLKKIGVDVIDMESAAITQTCWIFNIPCIVVRGVSNCAKTIITHEDIVISATHAAMMLEYILKES